MATPRGLAMLATLSMLLLVFMESTRFAGPFRRLVIGDPTTYKEGLAALAAVLPVLLAGAAWRSRAAIFPAGSGRVRRLAYPVLLSAYALSVWLPALVVDEPGSLSTFTVLQVVVVPLNILGFGFLLPAVLRRADYEVVFGAFLVVLVAFGILSLTWVALDQHTFFGLPLSEPPDDRGGRWAASGFFVHRNTIGGFLTCVIPAATFVGVSEFRRHQLTGALRTSLGILLLLVWLVLTFSRSSELGVVTTILVTGLLLVWTTQPTSPRAVRIQRWLRTLTVVGVIALLVGAASLVWLLPRLEPGLVSLISEGLHGRGTIWIEIWEKTSDYRWIGAGLFGVTGMGLNPHNAFLAQLAFFGIPGLISFVLLLALMIHEGWARYRRDVRLAPERAIILGAIVGILVQNVFEYFLTYPLLFSNSFALLLLGYWRTARDRPEDGESPLTGAPQHT